MRIKRQSEILSQMIDYTSSITTEVTDFTVGSAIRSMYDAFSIESESLYMLTVENIDEGIEQGLMSSFGFEPKDPVAAYGNVTIEFYTAPEQQVIISKGTTFKTASYDSPITFKTTKAYIIPAGVNSFTVNVEASETGTAGNVRVGEITQVDANLYNVSRVYNSEDFLTGTDGESYESTLARFKLFIEAIGRATKIAIKSGALNVSFVDTAYVYERVGRIDVFVADKNGNLSSEQQNIVQDALEDYRPAGIELYVYPMIKHTMDISATVYMTDPTRFNDRLKTDLVQQVRNYLNAFTADQDFVLRDLERVILNYDTDLIYDINISSVSENYLVQPDEIIRAGDINLIFEERTQ